VRAAEAETELLQPAPETQLWIPGLDGQTLMWKPWMQVQAHPSPQARKPVPATWSDTYLNVVAVISCAVVIAVTIMLVGLAV
jgi:hypothetical protein